ncbi:hypothetical protein [Aurantiacibacter luteus]|uniref:Lipoprotein n=1 Tax=Aurantiacibacter luteus TaxID=1581420 RepID=A0A0G9N2Y5_9SPHN|nr:hypothetical protein [Aurantiacibacter luteus]KLE35908.1 hypothetical protein AAW00_05990 [Aurantiacibacter luteus]
MIRRSVSAIALVGTLALSACIPPSPEPTPVPTPSPTASPVVQPIPEPVAVPSYDNWMDYPATPGDWTYRSAGTTTQALFGEANQGARLTISCDRSTRRVTIARAGSATGQVAMTIRTETQDRALTAGTMAGGTPTIAAQLSASDGLLDAMAFTKGRFALEVPGTSTLYVPAYPEISRVVEDCRG